MICYLFDTNIWSNWYRKDHDIIGKVGRLGKNDHIILSPVVWGEAVYGANVQPVRDCFDFSEYSRLIKTNSSPVICKIDEHTAKTYGELRAKLFEAYAPRPKKTNKLRLEELKCPASSNELQIQENDLWLVAQAIVYNYTFVTRDKMNAIKSITPKEFKCENW